MPARKGQAAGERLRGEGNDANTGLVARKEPEAGVSFAVCERQCKRHGR